MERKIHFLVNPSEVTAGTRGASLGPYAIMTAARKAQSMIFGSYPITTIHNQNAALDQPTSAPKAKRIEAFSKVFHELEENVCKTVQAGEFPIVLSGAHGSAAGTISGLKQANPDKKLGVVWVDAHADIHSPYTTPSGNIHGMPLAIALGLDNLDCQINDLNEVEMTNWEALKSSGNICPKIYPEDLVYAGVRDTEEQEDFLLSKYNITNHKVQKFKKYSPEIIGGQILEQLKDCDWIYLSFDVDSMDPAFSSYGTGTPVENGLHPKEVKALIAFLLKSKKVGCFEIVEVNPCLDDKINKMAEIAFEVLEESIINIEK